ncbi:MAG: 30S ribosomal protein S12 methylthiotransferase RimO [Desulfobulbaceae bacterium]|jgi:ribosomal protein S12 methylthiotransferase|nr:30S ribosomal protein S12 methylthiotransferase RimO [Desulfobulbaceae bacterium]
MTRLYAVTLGCPKNRVDTEVMLGLLSEAGYEIVTDPEGADILLVNTCGFIQPAVEEAIDVILDLEEIKTKQPGTRLVVTGCLVQRYAENLQRELTNVDLFIGTDGFQDIVQHLAQLESNNPPGIIPPPAYLMDCHTPRRLTTPPHRAYLKITEGCSNSCAYCMIPSIRGPLRSRSVADIITEAKLLDQNKIKEVTLVGQDLTAYGFDFGTKGDRLENLVQAILQETTLPWLRLLYLYPTRLPDQLLDLMAQEKRLLSYLDIPLQHVADAVLKRMKRPFGQKHIHAVIERIRAKVPEAAIRTTFMVGFPGETDQDVEILADFMLQYRLNNVGIFTYSNEEGCQAEFYPDQIEESVKQARFDYLMEIQSGISMELNQQYVGQTLDVLVEGVSEETELLLEGRTTFQAPGIDGCVYIADGECEQGDMVKMEITEAHPYDLVGNIVPTT